MISEIFINSSSCFTPVSYTEVDMDFLLHRILFFCTFGSPNARKTLLPADFAHLQLIHGLNNPGLHIEAAVSPDLSLVLSEKERAFPGGYFRFL